MHHESAFLPKVVNMKIKDNGNTFLPETPSLVHHEMLVTHWVSLLKLAQSKWLTRLLKYIEEFKRRDIWGPERGTVPTSFKKPFYLTDACEELLAYFVNKFGESDGKAESEILSGREISLIRYKTAAEICHVILEIQSHIANIDQKVEILQNHLLGLKSGTTYEKLLNTETKLGPDFGAPYWYLWGRFLDLFRNEGTDPLGKIGGCFLSPVNQQHVLKFRNAGREEFINEQYYMFRGVYTNKRNNKVLQNNPHKNKQNPFESVRSAGI
jgi:hypothetical protein